jgi:hypothetical protein
MSIEQEFANYSSQYNNQSQGDILIGFGPDSMQPGRLQSRQYAEPVQAGPGMAPTPVMASDIRNVLSQLSREEQGLLAIDMFAVGVYDNLGYMFSDEGELDQQYFVDKVKTTIDLARDSTSFGVDTDFLSVLLRTYNNTPESVSAALAQAKAAATAGGGGRVVNYIDPFALADAAKKATASVTGRMASAEEQQAFVKMIHGLQASGVSSISVPARAEAFARQQAPNEAAAMDYANAAGALMQVLGIGGR